MSYREHPGADTRYSGPDIAYTGDEFDEAFGSHPEDYWGMRDDWVYGGSMPRDEEDAYYEERSALADLRDAQDEEERYLDSLADDQLEENAIERMMGR